MTRDGDGRRDCDANAEAMPPLPAIVGEWGLPKRRAGWCWKHPSTLRAAGSQQRGSSNAPGGAGGKETKEPPRQRGSWELLATCERCKVAWGQEVVAEC